VIVGVGCDIMKVGRITRALARDGHDFLTEFLTPTELRQYTDVPHYIPAFAAAFAAKEALFKALGTGKRGKLSWHDIEVIQPRSSSPRMELSGATADAARARKANKIHLGLSVQAEQVLATVILETGPRLLKRRSH
jgi:holo-[acyl-carrier protein] synthase